VEFSDFNIPPNVIDIFFQLQNAGYRLIITHPERNAILLRHPERVREMVDCGAFVQLTANSITGFWGKPAQRYCEALLKEEMVHIIGSDAHDLKRRPPILSQARKAVARIIGQSGAQRLVQENPAALLHDQDLEF
jgi:protein-tyrosine phosphatase